MSKITLELLRKRAEHNNKELKTLEEISLHQENLTKIDLIQQACRHLKILYLQNNIISKIENLSKMKSLEYLNLALNNISLIENLEGCESLSKLDLTANFVLDLRCVANLRHNRKIKELFLTGNPCTELDGYRDYIINQVPQLETLDGKPITKSHRIQAKQKEQEIALSIEQQILSRLKQQNTKKQSHLDTTSGSTSQTSWYAQGKEKLFKKIPETDEEILENLDMLLDDDFQREFWQEETGNSPEARARAHQLQWAMQRAEELKENPPPEPKVRKFFKDDGSAYNMNEGGWDFELKGHDDSKSPNVELDFACYRHLHTAQIDLDVQPRYIRITIRDKIFQLALPVDVNPDKGTAQRSKVTGHLLVTVPKSNFTITTSRTKNTSKSLTTSTQDKGLTPLANSNSDTSSTLLEVKQTDTARELSSITNSKPANNTISTKPRQQKPTRENDADFVDNLDVPPLE